VNFTRTSIEAEISPDISLVPDLKRSLYCGATDWLQEGKITPSDYPWLTKGRPHRWSPRQKKSYAVRFVIANAGIWSVKSSIINKVSQTKDFDHQLEVANDRELKVWRDLIKSVRNPLIALGTRWLTTWQGVKRYRVPMLSVDKSTYVGTIYEDLYFWPHDEFLCVELLR
jgi:hypothetical protein